MYAEGPYLGGSRSRACRLAAVVVVVVVAVAVVEEVVFASAVLGSDEDGDGDGDASTLASSSRSSSSRSSPSISATPASMAAEISSPSARPSTSSICSAGSVESDDEPPFKRLRGTHQGFPVSGCPTRPKSCRKKAGCRVRVIVHWRTGVASALAVCCLKVRGSSREGRQENSCDDYKGRKEGGKERVKYRTDWPGIGAPGSFSPAWLSASSSGGAPSPPRTRGP